MPVKMVNGAVVFMKDVAQIHDGFAAQTNIVRENGRRSTLLTILRNGHASTLDIVNAVKAALPKTLAGTLPALQITPLFDQSIFVRAAMSGVVREAAATANEMFRAAQIGTLRILIGVPQTNAPGIIIGMPAKVEIAEFPGRIFEGKVTRTASSPDPNSRTLTVQIEIPNRDGKLLPGMYRQVLFQDHRAQPPLLVPRDSIIAGKDGSQVAILEDVPDKQRAKKIHLQTVQPGRDYGTQTEINPGDVVREGNLVRAQ